MAIEIHNLWFHYDPGMDVLKDISFSIRRGECVALLGHNGSGKSTLVKHLNGLLRPAKGTVEILGSPTENVKVSELASKVALLFQNPEDQICKGSVWEEAAFGARNLGYLEDRVQALVESSLEAFDLLSIAEANPHDLGGSERKRLAMASTLAMDTEILVLDEPTAGLDPKESAMLEMALHHLKDAGKTILIISHDMDFVAENMTRAICLENGTIQFDGNVHELFAFDALIERCGLLPPQVVQIGSHLGLTPLPLTPEELINVHLNNG